MSHCVVFLLLKINILKSKVLNGGTSALFTDYLCLFCLFLPFGFGQLGKNFNFSHLNCLKICHLCPAATFETEKRKQWQEAQTGISPFGLPTLCVPP